VRNVHANPLHQVTHYINSFVSTTSFMGLALVAAGCARLFDCETAELAVRYSPTGAFVARAYSLGCGATTKAATHVALYPANQARQMHDVFIYEGDGVDVKIAWIGPRELLVRYGPGTVFRNDERSDGIKISYEHIE
jgi:hypothetical protein